MLKIKTSNLKPGIKLGKDIYSYDSQLLLASGTTLTQEHLDSFDRRNIAEVFIRDESPRMKPQRDFEEVYQDTLDVVKSFMVGVMLGGSLDVEELDIIVGLLKEQVYDAIDLFRQIRLMKDKGEYLYTHSINVSLLCIMIGKWLKCDSRTIAELGMAGLLHDLGKVFIENEILNKPGKLTDKEYERIKRHTVLGYNYISQNPGMSPEVAKAALMHHERIDGSGYPSGLRGEMNFYAAVVAVADVFDAITSAHSYADKRSPYSAAEILWQESFGKLDAKISKVFYDKITNFYVGNKVLLSNGKEGLVIFADPSLPTRPIVMVEDEFYNLATDRTISILDIID